MEERQRLSLLRGPNSVLSERCVELMRGALRLHEDMMAELSRRGRVTLGRHHNFVDVFHENTTESGKETAFAQVGG